MIEDISNLIEKREIDKLKELMASENIEIRDGKLVHKNKDYCSSQATYWDMIQLIKKINLNSLYGSIINMGSEFFDQRLGQSCTLSGRCTTRHMGSTINEKITGTYGLGDAIIYGDTDSIFFTVPENNILNLNHKDIDKEDFLKLSNRMEEEVNETFPHFFRNTFNVPKDNLDIINCGREICATSALFIKKKRYAALYYIDDKNIRHDKNGKNGKLKIMGLDIKRADCPEWVQDKLEETLYYLLDKKATEDEILDFIRDWRKDFMEKEPWKMGIPKRVNKLTYYKDVFDRNAKGITVPGHARASINWNNLRDINFDKNSMNIQDGQKVIVCKLKKNQLDMTAVAYPIDQQFLPEWFKELPFDIDEMVQVAIDQKIKNIFGVLGYDLTMTQTSDQFQSLFSFE